MSVVAASLVIIWTLFKYVLASRRPKGFPKGPDTVPLLGNLHQLPTSKAFLKWVGDQITEKRNAHISTGFRSGAKTMAI